MTDQPSRGPLDGLVVADFSRVLAGPYATMLLADLGADVIKVESPDGDDTRRWMPPVRDGVSTYYLSINRNKRSIALDLKDDEDLQVARALADRADIMIQNFRVGGMEPFGLDYDSVKATNPAVIYSSITGFGTGAGAAMPGYDLMVQGISGLMSLTGPVDGIAYRAGISAVDVIAGLHAMAGILAALHRRDQTGEGDHVEVNLLSSVLSGLVNHTSAVVAGDTVPSRMGNAHPSLFPYEPLPTRDGEIIVIAANDNQFRLLCDVLDRSELAQDPRFASNLDRTDNRDELRTLLVEALSTRTSQEWFDALLEAGLPGGPVNSVRQGVDLAEELGLDPIVRIGEDQVPSIRNPIRFSATAPSYRHAPPTIGEQDTEIRAWLRHEDH